MPGRHNRKNAYLVLTELKNSGVGLAEAKAAIESFPGSGRRFEKLADNLYSDYGHHPTEIKATLQMARELSDHVVLVTSPHCGNDLFRDLLPALIGHRIETKEDLKFDMVCASCK